MRAFVLLLAASLLAGCAGPGGVAPEGWRLSAEPVAGGVLVKWNVPPAEQRKLDLEVRRVGERQATQRVALGASDVQARLLDELPWGDWEFNLVVTDPGTAQRSLRAGPVTFGVELQPLRPLTDAELGLAHGFDTPVLVALPPWGASLDPADATVRASLEHHALETARVAFGRASLVRDDADVLRVRDVREQLLRAAPGDALPFGLDARGLVVVDLRPAMGNVPTTLSLRLLDVAYGGYRELTPQPWNRYALVFEDYVPLPDLPWIAGRSQSAALMAGFRALYSRMSADPHARAWFDAVAGGNSVFLDAQERLADVVGWIGDLPAQPDGGRLVSDVEAKVLFQRDDGGRAAPAPMPVESSDEPAPAEGASADDAVEAGP